MQRALILKSGDAIDEESVQFLPTHVDDVKENARIYKKGMKLDDVERQLYREAIAAYGSVGAAAKALQVSKSTLWRRATALGIETGKHQDADDEEKT